MNKVYEVIIIGSGPAGLTAGIYASRAELDTLIIERNGISGGQIINTYEVDNYPGLSGISGYELATKFREHLDHLGGKFISGNVNALELEGEVKKITLDNGEIYSAKSIIIAAGAVNRKLNVKGEIELSGMGVSYCATCDGAFFRNKTVAVVGGGDVAVEDAIFLARMCKKVHVIHRRDEFRAAKTLSTKLLSLENVEVHWDSTVNEIIGKDNVVGISITNINTKDIKVLDLEGVFIAVGMSPNSEIYKGIIDMDEYGYIIAGEDCKTNVKGVFVAGDIRTKILKQVITAAADGANAITAVERYLYE